jgi:hypothetical protein
MTSLKEKHVNVALTDAPEHLQELVEHLSDFYKQENKELIISSYLPREPKRHLTRYSMAGGLRHNGDIAFSEALLLTVIYDNSSRLVKIKERHLIPIEARTTLLAKWTPQLRVVITRYEYSAPIEEEIVQVRKQVHSENIARFVWVNRREKVNRASLLKLFSPYASEVGHQYLIMQSSVGSRYTFIVERDGKTLTLCDKPPHIYISLDNPAIAS